MSASQQQGSVEVGDLNLAQVCFVSFSLLFLLFYSGGRMVC